MAISSRERGVVYSRSAFFVRRSPSPWLYQSVFLFFPLYIETLNIHENLLTTRSQCFKDYYTFLSFAGGHWQTALIENSPNRWSSLYAISFPDSRLINLVTNHMSQKGQGSTSRDRLRPLHLNQRPHLYINTVGDVSSCCCLSYWFNCNPRSGLCPGSRLF